MPTVRKVRKNPLPRRTPWPSPHGYSCHKNKLATTYVRGPKGATRPSKGAYCRVGKGVGHMNDNKRKMREQKKMR